MFARGALLGPYSRAAEATLGTLEADQGVGCSLSPCGVAHLRHVPLPYATRLKRGVRQHS
eukprot:6238709-Prymnesium_polylepis.2